MPNGQRPDRPQGFPLFAHASGKWAKKIDGRTHYFGRWGDPAGALRLYETFLAHPERRTDMAHTCHEVTVADGCNRFLSAKDEAVKRCEISQHSFADYRRTAGWMCEYFGRDTPIRLLSPENFTLYKEKLSQRRSVGSLGNEITRVRVIFKWCWDQRLIDGPPHFGQEFRRPSMKALRRYRREQGKKLLTREQILLMMDECGVHLHTMVLLGINCGFGNTDCATLRLDGVDLERGWIQHARPKTEVDRRIPLWPETIEALRRSLARRYTPITGNEKLFFLRHNGKTWTESDNWIAKHVRQAMSRVNVGRGSFYWLRHCFATVGGEVKDQVAMNYLMGHVDGSMASHYREEIGDDRLRAVVEHVRKWLFGL